jgi:hypothetical protein
MICWRVEGVAVLIAYSLVCERGHQFEGWFQSSVAYDDQSAAGSIACPICGDRRIAKGIMAPAVRTSVTKRKGRPDPNPAPPPMPANADPSKVQQFMAGFRKYVQENADYVGPRFPEEARKIHYREVEERQIYGEATPDEARDLLEEGIDIAALPPDPNDLN